MKSFTGRAVVYNQASEMLYGRFREEIAPGAFDESLRSGRDVYCSLDHDMQKVLGRQSAGTLRLTPDSKGIAVECANSDYSYARDLRTAMQSGDLSGMSFIFDVIEDSWQHRDGVPYRIVRKADLYEVAFVFFPAYPETDASMRSLKMQLARKRIELALATCDGGSERMYHSRGRVSTLLGDDADRAKLRYFLHENRSLLFEKRKRFTPAN